MAKRSRRRSTGNQEIPEFMRPHAGKGIENLAFEDLAFGGEGENFSGRDSMRKEKRLCAPPLALAHIVEKIVANFPDSGGKAKRVHQAMTALLGPKRAKRCGIHAGRPPNDDDYQILLHIAREYLRRLWRFSEGSLEFADIYRSIQDRDKTRSTQDTRIRVLGRKFTARKHELLMHAHNRSDRFDLFESQIRVALVALSALNLTKKRPSDKIPRIKFVA